MLQLRCSNHLRVLARDLALAWREPSPGGDRLLVQSTALASWLERMLARDWGIAADLELLLPQHWLKRLGGTGDARWRRETLRWRLETAVPEGQLPADPLARHRLLEQLADAFDTWQVQRTPVLTSWLHDPPSRDRRFPTGPVLAGGLHDKEDDGWLAQTWRALHAQGEGPDRGACLAALVADVRAGRVALPPRLGAFAVAHLPPVFIELFLALAERCELTLWLWSPTPQPWADLPGQRELARARRQTLLAALAKPVAQRAEVVARSAGLLADAGHPLVTALAGHARTWFRALSGEAVEQAWTALPFVAPERDSLLHRIQADVVALEPPTAGAATDPGDRSLSFHDCPGPRRELEVLRDALAQAFIDDPDLRPDQVLVLLPDVAAYAPLIPAVFGQGVATTVGSAPIPYRIVDRSVAVADPLAGALLAVLALLGGRRTRSEVVALLLLDPVHSALGLDQDGLDRAVQLLDRAGVRWGADAAARSTLGGGGDGTWAAARDRIAAGWWLGPDPADPALPVAGTLLEDIAPAASVLAWIEDLNRRLDEAAQPRPLSQWLAWTAGLMRATLLAPGDRSLAASALDALLDDCRTAAGSLDPVLPPAVWTDLLTGLLDGSESPLPGGAPGGVTFAGLKPLRTIPAAFVALLGMDDAAVPRRHHPPAWDLTAATAPVSGDRDPRAEDRQLVFEAILAAGERLHVSWVGRDARTGQPRPPAGVVAALLDVVARTVTGAAPVTIHPRHQQGPSADPVWAAAAGALAVPGPERALTRPFQEVGSDVPAGAPASLPVEWTLPLLERTLADAAAAWLRHRLGIVLDGGDTERDDHEPFALDPLARWNVRNDLATALATGAPPPDRRRLEADGVLPPGELGTAPWSEATAFAATLAGRIRAAGGGGALVERTVSDEKKGWILSGRIRAPGPHGLVLWHAADEVDKPRQQLRLWLHALLWNASLGHGEEPCAARLIGLEQAVGITVMQRDFARERLGEVMALAQRCCRSLVPLLLRAGRAFIVENVDLEAVAGLCGVPGEARASAEDQPDAASAALALAWRDQPMMPWDHPDFASENEELWFGFTPKDVP